MRLEDSLRLVTVDLNYTDYRQLSKQTQRPLNHFLLSA